MAAPRARVAVVLLGACSCTTNKQTHKAARLAAAHSQTPQNPARTRQVWQTGAVANLLHPVDSAKAAAETPAGFTGIKVWLVFKSDAVGKGSFFDIRLKSPHTLAEVLAMPRAAPVRASSSAWWATPGPPQPAHVGAWAPYRRGIDALALFGGGSSDGGAALTGAEEEEDGGGGRGGGAEGGGSGGRGGGQ